jgi:phosphomethylpyrimidine synthase
VVHHKRENPLYERFDEILEICREHDVSLSLGDGPAPRLGCRRLDAAQLDTLEGMNPGRNSGLRPIVQINHKGFGQLGVSGSRA